MQAKSERGSMQRQLILSELRGVDSHPTADQVYDLVRRKMPRISLGTVYRNLESLVEAGEIQKLELAGRQRRYDGNAQRHLHIRCECCGGVGDVCLEQTVGQEVLAASKAATGYRVTGYRLELSGVCPACQE